MSFAHGQALNPGVGGETILFAGGVAEVSGGVVKIIPLSEAPVQLREALKAFNEGR